MKASRYKKIAEHPLRPIFRNLIQDARDLPSRTELRERINEAVPGADAKVKEALFTKAVELAQKAQAEGRDAWFDLRGSADRLVLTVVEGLEAADRLVPLPAEEEVDVKSLANAIEDSERVGGGHDRAIREEQERIQELLRKGGLA
jgi:hypothetical protein